MGVIWDGDHYIRCGTGREGSKKKKQILLLSYQQYHLSVLIRILRPSQGPSGAMT